MNLAEKMKEKSQASQDEKKNNREEMAKKVLPYVLKRIDFAAGEGDTGINLLEILFGTGYFKCRLELIDLLKKEGFSHRKIDSGDLIYWGE